MKSDKRACGQSSKCGYNWKLLKVSWMKVKVCLFMVDFAVCSDVINVGRRGICSRVSHVTLMALKKTLAFYPWNSLHEARSKLCIISGKNLSLCEKKGLKVYSTWFVPMVLCPSSAEALTEIKLPSKLWMRLFAVSFMLREHPFLFFSCGNKQWWISCSDSGEDEPAPGERRVSHSNQRATPTFIQSRSCPWPW